MCELNTIAAGHICFDILNRQHESLVKTMIAVPSVANSLDMALARTTGMIVAFF